MLGRPAMMIRSPSCRPGGHLVQVDEARRLPGDRSRILVELVQAAHDVGEQGRHLREALARAPARLPDLEDLGLGLVQELARLAPLGGIGRVRDIGPDLGQLAHDRPLANDLRVAADVGGRRRAGGELVQVRDAAHVPDLAIDLQRLGDREHVRRLVVLDELGDGAPQHAVVRAVEIRLADEVADPVPCGIGEQQPAQHRLLGFHRVRRQAQRFDLGVARNGARKAVRARSGRCHDWSYLLFGWTATSPRHRAHRVCHARTSLFNG
jgi:hypothetical protein